MAATVKQMLEAANAAVPKITPAQAKEMIAKGNTLVVDVRDGTEVAASGKVAGAVHVSRGMLEFRADPESSYHDKNFSKRQGRYSLLRLGRALGARRQIAQGPRLREGLQSGRLQGLGRQRRRGRQIASHFSARISSQSRACARRLAARTPRRPKQCHFRPRRCRPRQGYGERRPAWRQRRRGWRDCRR